MADWVRQNCLLGGALSLWLVALSPVGNLGKAVCYFVAFGCALEAIQESSKLIKLQARQKAISAMNAEIEDLQLALETHAQQTALHEIYGTSSPEVKEEVLKQLEHLYNEPSTKQEDQTYTYRYHLFLAVSALLEVNVSETFIIESVLKMGGRNWDKGKQFLQELLEEGQAKQWG